VGREIREYFIPDFSNRKDHDSYQEAFQWLISDYKSPTPSPKDSGRARLSPDSRRDASAMPSQTACPEAYSGYPANRPFGSFPIWNSFAFHNFEKNL